MKIYHPSTSPTRPPTTYPTHPLTTSPSHPPSHRLPTTHPPQTKHLLETKPGCLSHLTPRQRDQCYFCKATFWSACEAQQQRRGAGLPFRVSCPVPVPVQWRCCQRYGAGRGRCCQYGHDVAFSIRCGIHFGALGRRNRLVLVRILQWCELLGADRLLW